MEWRDQYDTGEGFGTAVIVDEFNKEVPATAHYGKREVPSLEKQDFTVEVSLSDLNDRTPTKVFLYLAVKVNGENDQVRAEFALTW